MGRRYYCEYCDKSFVETPDIVKKHIRGLQHKKLRNEYYARFEDKRKILEIESKKKTCMRYESGNCIFGATCRFSHYSKQDLDRMRWEVEQQSIQSSLQKQRAHPYYIMKDWLFRRRKLGLVNTSSLEKVFIENVAPYEDNLSVVTGWTYPIHLNDVANLPPSLKKLQLSDFNDDNYAEWG